MASKSLTALPSVVSVMAEKSVVAMRCHTRGFEKVLWPVVGIILTTLAFICYAVAAGTPMWVQLKVFNSTTANTTSDKGYINFGIFSGSHVIEYRERPIVDTIQDSYFVFEKFTNTLTSRLYTAFAFSVIAMLLCIAMVCITFLNSYQTVTTWWKGPPMMYILSLLIGFSAFMAVGLFADFYLWDMDPRQVFIDSTTFPGTSFSYEYLLRNESYQLVPTLHYSFGLQVGGSILPVIVLLISWRLMLLLPVKKIGREAEANDEFEMQMSETNGSILPTNQMAMSMNAAAAGPMAVPMTIPVPVRPAGPGGQYMTGEGGLLY